jgi:hypothetical protein
MINFSCKTKIFNIVLITLCLGVNSPVFAKKPSPTKKECNDALVAGTDVNLKFGTFEGAVAGTITVNPTGSRTSTGLVYVGGTFSAAIFSVYSTIDGCNAFPVKITLPKNPSDLTGAGTVMAASTFVSDPDTSFTLDPNANVSMQVKVGATLITNALQAGGTYTTGTPFTIKFKH